MNDRLAGVNIGEDEIELDGFMFELDRSVPRIGKYLGQATGPRIKEIKVIGKTTNSASVEVDARNAEGGEYTYLYKKDSEGEETWKEAHKGNENTYTFNNLEANVIYNIKVKVTTKEGETEGTVNVLTGEIPEGTVTFGNVTWASSQASVTVSTNTGMQIEYQINGMEEGNWKTIANGGTISGIQHGQTVYARLTDGTNHGDYASVTITDTTAPIVSNVTTGEITENSIAVTVVASDNESGLATSNTYKYYLNGTLKQTQTSNTFKFTGLAEDTEYTIKVEVYDKAGNKGENTIKVNTKKAGMNAEEISRNPTAYYGSEVRGYTCNSKGVNKWRIFYADSTNIYLIADDYISYLYAPNGKERSKIDHDDDYKLSFDYVFTDYSEGANWIKDNSKGEKWLNEFLNKYSSSTNRNIRAVAYMMDTNVWNIYAGEDAEYAMGGPTVEMYCESYKDTHQSKYIEYESNSIGYNVKWSTSSKYSSYISGMPLNEFNKIYVKFETSNIKTEGMWLVSPSSLGNDGVMYVSSDGNIDGIKYDLPGYGLRPIVCLKSGIKLKKVSDEIYEIVK